MGYPSHEEPVFICRCGEVVATWGGIPEPRLSVNLHRLKVIQKEGEAEVCVQGRCRGCSTTYSITNFRPPFG